MMAILLQFLRRDLLIFKREYPGKFFDTCFLFFTNVIVFSYFMPQAGLSSSYGPFLLIGAIASFGLFDVVGKVGVLVADIEGDKTISSWLIMPITSRALFLYIGVSWALSSALLSILLFPIGKLLLFDRFDLSLISIPKTFIMYITINLFFGFFSLWLTSMIRGIGGVSGIFMRFINPLFMFGAYFYSWKASYALSPVIGYISLFNPMVYVMEGMRAAAIGQTGYLPFWLSFGALWIFIIACALHGTSRLMKRLDCV